MDLDLQKLPTLGLSDTQQLQVLYEMFKEVKDTDTNMTN